MTAESCPRCTVLEDELAAARALAGEEIKTLDYLEFLGRAEFARTWVDHLGERLYVHCEQALGETAEEFNARYRRVRHALGAKYRKTPKVTAPQAPEVVLAPRPDNQLFTGRL